MAPPQPRDPDFESKFDRAFKALHEIISNIDVAGKRDLIFNRQLIDDLITMNDRNVWRLWAPNLPKEIVTQQQMDMLVTAMILLLRAVDRHVQHDNASQRMKEISSNWYRFFLPNPDLEFLLSVKRHVQRNASLASD